MQLKRLIGIIKMPKIKTKRRPKMGPLITNQDNSFIYFPGKKENIKSGLDYDPMKWKETWYLNTTTERSSI
jgi:hypothetical protein